jgi:hypothetical protein
MAREGSLYIVRLHDPHTREWRYLLYFTPYDRPLNTLPYCPCAGTAELEAVLLGLGFDDLDRVRVIADVQRDSAGAVGNIRTTDDKLRELGFS